MAKKIFFGNYKGGVGKTTTVFEIGLVLSEKYNKKVLLIDLDPQCSLSRILNMEMQENEIGVDMTLNYGLELYSEYIQKCDRIDILKGDIDFGYSMTEAIRNFKPNLDYIITANSIKNSRLNDIAERMGRNKKNILAIAKIIMDIEEGYDYILFDCPPTSNILTQGIFLYSDYYLIPTIADDLSIDGVPDYISEINGSYLKYAYADEVGGIVLKKYFGEMPRLIGVLITIFKDTGNRVAEGFDEIKRLDDTISHLKIETLIKKSDYKLNGMGNILSKVVNHRDNRSNPRKLGVPKTVISGEIHEEYLEVVEQLIAVLGE